MTQVHTTFDDGTGVVEVELYDPADLAGGSILPAGTTAAEPAAAGVPWSFDVGEPSGLYHAAFFDSDGELVRVGACLFDGRDVVGVGDYDELDLLRLVRYRTDLIGTAEGVLTSGIDSRGEVTIVRGDNWTATWTTLALSATDAHGEAVDLTFTVAKERELDDAGSELLQVDDDAGLTLLNKEAADFPTDATVVFDAALGTAVVVVKTRSSKLLQPQAGLAYDLQARDAAGEEWSVRRGRARVLSDVTR